MTPRAVMLQEVAQTIRGVEFEPEDKRDLGLPDSVACFRTCHIQDTLSTDQLFAISRHAVRRSDQHLYTGDVLMASANSRNQVGRCCLVESLPFPAVAGGFVTILRPNPARVLPAYLYQLLSAPQSQQVLRSLARQTTNLANIPREVLRQLRLELPDLEMQRRVADRLQQAQTLCHLKARSLFYSEALRHATFLEVVGDPVSNPYGWLEVSLGSVLTDVQYGTCANPNQQGHGLPLLRMNNVTSSGYLELQDLAWCEIKETQVVQYTVRRGDVLFNRTNSPELVGKLAVWDRDERYAFASYLIRLRVDSLRLRPGYLSAYFNSYYGKQYLRSQALSSSNMSNLSAPRVKALRLKLPPLEVQDRLLDRLASLDGLRDGLFRSQQQLRTLLQTLQSGWLPPLEPGQA